MDSQARAIEERLRTLREDYEAGLPEKLARIDAAVQAWLRNLSDPHVLDTLHRMVHSLVGSSGTYGLHALSQAARALELDLRTIRDGWTPPSSKEQERIVSQAAALAQVPPDAAGATRPPSGAAPADTPAPAARRPSENHRVWLAGGSAEGARDLADQIAHFGYEVQTFAGLRQLASRLVDAHPSAIIVDTGLFDPGSEDARTLAGIQQGRDRRLPAVLISARGDLEARLQAVRAGASAYFTKPVDVDELVDRLDMLTAKEAPEPFRVLIVDDSPDLAGYLAAHLEQAGMTTATVTDPMQVMGPLVDLNPDLILMDLYMPGCSGLELAAVIRQQKGYLGTPIVFLSAETNLDTQMEALRLGGDDFITKPVEIGHLISSVTSRTLRSRSLRALMIRDSLTGLLNHTATEERLGAEVARAQRQHRPLSYALIDLDHFKRVNDTHGHSTGDRVLATLSRLLQQRLRKSDVIGRVGGEEFAVVFTDTDGAVAAGVLNEIRERFSQVRHSSGVAAFHVTFSGGIAAYPACPDAATLHEAADKSLYEAKQQGRNRVELAGTDA